MPLVLGLASSHAPSMMVGAEQWPAIHKALTGDLPQPSALAQETPEVLEQFVLRIDAGFAMLGQLIHEAELDALVIMGDDQTEVFSKACVPAFSICTSEEMEGSVSVRFIGQKLEDNRVKVRGAPALASAMVEGLMMRGFDPAHLAYLQPMGRPESGLGHAFTRVAKRTGVVDSQLPVVPLLINSSHRPFPSGRRCHQLGTALREIFAGRPERIGVYASGGMSHDPLGPRAGWIDEPLDHFVLRTIESGDSTPLADLFSFDSDTMRGGTGELRSWIATAAALDGVKATIIDYIPAVHSVTGLGFAYWQPTENENARIVDPR